MPIVHLPLGYPTISGDYDGMLVFQGTVVRRYVVPKDPRTDSQLFERRMFSDVKRVIGSLGKWGRSACRLVFGSKWSTIIYEIYKSDMDEGWTLAMDSYSQLSAEQKAEWNEAAPYQATFNEPGRLFFGVGAILFYFLGSRYFVPSPFNSAPGLLLAWWIAELDELGFQVQTQPGSFYDDRDWRWSYTGNYSTWNGSQPIEGTLIQLNSPGSKGRIRVNASVIKIAYMENSDCGLFTVYVDGVEKLQVDGNGASFEQKVSADILVEGGWHEVEVVHSGGQGQKVNIDGVYGHMFYRSTDSDVIKSGYGIQAPTGGYSYEWIERSGHSYFYCEFLFVGSYLQIGFMKQTSNGAAKVIVDGEVVDQISMFRLGDHEHNEVIIGRFPYGLHVGRIENYGSDKVNFTRVRVLRSKNKVIL